MDEVGLDYPNKQSAIDGEVVGVRPTSFLAVRCSTSLLETMMWPLWPATYHGDSFLFTLEK